MRRSSEKTDDLGEVETGLHRNRKHEKFSLDHRDFTSDGWISTVRLYLIFRIVNCLVQFRWISREIVLKPLRCRLTIAIRSGKFVHQMLCHVNLCKFSPKLIMLLFDSPYEIFWLSPTGFEEKIRARLKGEKETTETLGLIKITLYLRCYLIGRLNRGLVFTRLTYIDVRRNDSSKLKRLAPQLTECAHHIVGKEYITKGDIQPGCRIM